MEPISASVNIVEESDVMLPPRPPHTYFGIAQSMVGGVVCLAGANSPLAMSLVASHVLECALKAYLSRDGSDSRLKRPPLNHDLKALWRLAHNEGLNVPEDPPEWVKCLSHLHKRPYYLRYSTDVHGIVSPGPEPMTSELTALVAVVGRGL
jgi:HEPN domain-containing protein